MSRALISMGKKDLSELIEEQGRAELTALAMTKNFQMDRYDILEALTNNGVSHI